ncbi:MAG TPA: hypothetical protein VF363_04800 [Candidatus Eisenbacteria bacterium]
MNERDDAVPSPKDEAVSRLLDRAEMVEPPADLRENVLHAIETRRPARPAWSWLGVFGAGFKQRPAFGMVYPFAVGAVAGVVAFALLSGRMDLRAPGGPDGMSGAMVPTAPHVAGSAVDDQRFELNGANVRFETVRQGDQVRAAITTRGDRDVELTLRFDPSRLRPVAFRQDRAWDGTMEYGQGRLRLVQSGERRYEIDFEGSGAGDAPIRVTMVVRGSTAEGEIHTGPSGPGA